MIAGGCPGYHGRKREYTAPGPSCSIVRVKCKVHSRARSAIICLSDWQVLENHEERRLFQQYV
jgi:hypothetical protein